MKTSQPLLIFCVGLPVLSFRPHNVYVVVTETSIQPDFIFLYILYMYILLYIQEETGEQNRQRTAENGNRTRVAVSTLPLCVSTLTHTNRKRYERLGMNVNFVYKHIQNIQRDACIKSNKSI